MKDDSFNEAKNTLPTALPSELLPCPFCGGNVELLIDDQDATPTRMGWWYVFCDLCLIQTCPQDSPAAVVSIWNTRAGEIK